MADTKVSALPVTSAALGQKLPVADTGTSFAITVSSMAAIAPASTQDEGIIFNASGVHSSAASNLRYHYSTQTMHFDSVSSAIWIDGNATDAPAPPAGTLSIYSKNISGRMMLKAIGPSGINYPLQPSMFQQSIGFFVCNSSTAQNLMGDRVISEGAFSSAVPVVGNALSTKRRGTFRNSSASINLRAGVSSADNQYFLSSSDQYGGFFFHCRAGLENYNTSCRYFIGMSAQATTAVCTSNPTSLTQTVGFAMNDTGSSWVFMSGSTGTITTIAISHPGLSVGSQVLYDFYLFAPQNKGTVYYRMDDLNANSTLINSSITTPLPTSTTFMKGFAWCGNLSASSGAANIALIRMYIESDI